MVDSQVIRLPLPVVLSLFLPSLEDAPLCPSYGALTESYKASSFRDQITYLLPARISVCNLATPLLCSVICALPIALMTSFHGPSVHTKYVSVRPVRKQ